MVEGVSMLKNEKVACDGCALAKMHRDEFPSNPDKKKRDALDFVHNDVFGPMQTRSLRGAFYFLLFIKMIAQDTHGFTSLNEKMMVLGTLRNLEPWWKSRQENPSKSSVQIKGESMNQGNSTNIAKRME
jgi:hypothetical protein